MSTNKVAIIVSPNWRDYAKKYLTDCLISLKQQDYLGETKIFLVDNESTEESFNYLKTAAPGIEILRNSDNAGFAKGNNVAMRAALEQGFAYIILFNMDTEVGIKAVSELVKMAESDKQIGAVQARLMLHPEKEKINSLGNATHFLGFGYTIDYKQQFSGRKLQAVDIFYPSGAAVLYKAEALKEVGLFDEEFWMYNEDQELGWRLWLAGWRSVLAPEAVVYHKYEFSRSIKRLYWMDRNRILSILKCYRLPTLILILPAFLLMEFGLLVFSLKSGWFLKKLEVYGYFFSASNWLKLYKSRQAVQKLRKIKDRQIAQMISGKIMFQEFDGVPLKIANFFFNLYWQIIKIVIVW
jgi:GT2 family glycosyltransferase